jgi:DNA-binding transcriptional LysR family regulator
MSRPIGLPAKRTIAHFQRLCCMGIRGEMLIPLLLREIEGLVPSQNGTFFWAGPHQELVNMCATGPAAALLPMYLSEFHNHPEREVLLTFTEAMRADWPSEAVDFFARTLKVHRDEFVRTDLFNQLYRPIGGEQITMLRLRDHGKPLGAIGLFRSNHEAAFSSAEILQWESVGPFIAHAVGGHSDAAPIC